MPIYLRTAGYKIYFWSNEAKMIQKFGFYRMALLNWLTIKGKFLRKIYPAFFLLCKVTILIL